MGIHGVFLDMNKLKIMCLVFCVLPLASMLPHGHIVTPAPLASGVAAHGPLHALWFGINFIFFAGAYYGIQKRAPVMWRVGWGLIVFGVSEFLILALSATVKFPATDHPWIASFAVVVGATVVASYWGFWWMRQKSYFTGQYR